MRASDSTVSAYVVSACVSVHTANIQESLVNRVFYVFGRRDSRLLHQLEAGPVCGSRSVYRLRLTMISRRLDERLLATCPALCALYALVGRVIIIPEEREHLSPRSCRPLQGSAHCFRTGQNARLICRLGDQCTA